MSPKHLHRYTSEFGYRYNNREDSGVMKFQDVVKNSGKVRLTYEKLIGGKTKQTLDRLADKYTNNPMPGADDWMENIDPDNTPTFE